LSSVLYSFYTQTPLVFVEGAHISPFDFFDKEIDLSLLKIEPTYALKKPDNKKIIVGMPKQKVYQKILTLLSLSGLTPFSHLAKSITIQNDSLKIATEGNKVFEIGYNNLIVFDDKKINGLSSPIKQNHDEIRHVMDWFEVNLGSTHDIDYIETDDMFVNKIFFYSSQRDYVTSDKKDLLAISYLTEKAAINDYQYSDTYARFKVLKCMKAAGIKGPKNGKNPNYPNRSSEPFKWLSPKIKLMRRDIIPPPMALYEDTQKIKFCYDSPEEVIAKNTINLNSYTSKLLNVL